MIYNEIIPLQTQSIILNGILLCAFSRPYSWQNEEGGWHICRPAAWICPYCLRTWAFAPILQREEEPFEIFSSPCEQHGGGFLIKLYPFIEPDAAFIDYGPRELLTRELLLAIDRSTS